MSFSNEVKLEIVQNRPMRLRYKKSQAYGLLLYTKSFGPEEISFGTEMAEMAELYKWFVHSLAGKTARVLKRERSLRGKPFYEVSVPARQDRDRLLAALGHRDGEINGEALQGSGRIHAFLSGAWMACGSVTAPEKGYHLEFVVRNKALCEPLRELLSRFTGGPGQVTRRGAEVLYFKECAEIEDLLTLMGASKASLAMIEVEIVKNIRNKANRITNCETANIDKLVGAASAQTEDIRLILEQKGADWLPENLRQVALLRIENPDMSLRELAEASSTPISRSGMHHRLDKLSRLAQAIRDTLGREEDV